MTRHPSSPGTAVPGLSSFPYRMPPVVPLFRDPHYTFTFADDRLITRVHLDGVPAGTRVRFDRLPSGTGSLGTAVMGDGGWVDLPAAMVVRAGDGFTATPLGGPPRE